MARLLKRKKGNILAPYGRIATPSQDNDAASKSYVLAKLQYEIQIADLHELKILVVSELPAIGEEYIMYLVPHYDNQIQNGHDKYLYIDNSYDFLGNTNGYLNDYATNSYVDDKINTYIR